MAHKMILHVGYHKTGTTWLQRSVWPYLEGVRLVSRRNRVARGLLRGMTHHGANWRPRELAALTVRGRTMVSWEALAGVHWDNLDGKQILGRMLEIWPEAHVLVFVRRQDDMIWSLYNLHVMQGHYDSFARWWRDYLSLDRLHYHELIGMYRDVYGQDNVTVVPYEALRADPDTTLRAVCVRIDASLKGWRYETRNPSLGRPSLHVLRAANAAALLLPADRRRRARLSTRALLQERGLRKPRGPHLIARRLIERDQDRFAESNGILQCYVSGWDLHDLGYSVR